jgi:hypothetical protein
MILVTLKANSGTSRAERIMQVNPDSIESMQDLVEGGCRIFLSRETNASFDVEESTAAIAHGLRQTEFTQYRENNNAAMDAFDRMTRYLGWIAFTLAAIAVATVFLVVGK